LWFIKVWFSASTLVLKIATFAKPETVMPHCRATEQTSTIRAKNGRQNANASQNKKSYNATHKPTQLQHI
jgi:hypothetical protein